MKKYRLIILTLLGIPIFLLLDSHYGDQLFGYGQHLTTLLVLAAFMKAYVGSPQRVKHVMLIGVVVGMAGELFFSLLLGMYHYRLENVPLWVALAHGLIFALVFRLSHKSWVKQSEPLIQSCLLLFAAVYSLFWLLWANDWYGFLCSVAFMAILFTAKKSRLFFLIMFAVVCYIEQVGTATGCWYWPETLLGIESWLPSGNPPSGIAVFYFLFDAAVFWFYMYILHPKTKLRYQSMVKKSLYD
ncbi:MAG: hypothetical protein Q9M31_10570 [Mariprofundus sp.]|nr:hypothetical protein [Mariprofundus sp.]